MSYSKPDVFVKFNSTYYKNNFATYFWHLDELCKKVTLQNILQIASSMRSEVL